MGHLKTGTAICLMKGSEVNDVATLAFRSNWNLVDYFSVDL